MAPPRPDVRPDLRAPATLFARHNPDHVPAEALTERELAASIDSLERKLRSARRSLLAAQLAGALITLVVLALGGILLWFGPTPFLENVFGHGGSLKATTYDVFVWWLAVIVLAVMGGAFGDQMLRGRLRMARGWKSRVADLTRRLEDARHVQHRRAAP
ncbi:MAG: hypothetical protein HY084_10410 [Gemmatimonadetes bacterium]|nr:hypothetical protein [Gemmatimonadota bacterium]